jgi:hypothetical protein
VELKDFVKESLCSIAEGVAQANLQLPRWKAAANSTLTKTEESIVGWSGSVYETVTVYREATVEFDVAIVASEENSSEKGGKLTVATPSFFGVKAGVDGGTTLTGATQASTTSRIKFSIPLTLPEGDRSSLSLPGIPGITN